MAVKEYEKIKQQQQKKKLLHIVQSGGSFLHPTSIKEQSADTVAF